MDRTYNAKIAAVKLKTLIGWVGGSSLRCNYYHEYLACEEEDFVNDTYYLKGSENYCLHST